jgi:hypothetical protein
MGMPSKVLFVAASGANLQFDFASELEAMETAAKRSRGAFSVASRWSVDPPALTDLLAKQRPEVLHLVSPGVDEKTLELCLCNTRGEYVPVKPKPFAKLFAGPTKSRPRLVLLNTCFSGKHAEAVAANAGCAIGMKDLVWDKAAVEFSARFYSTLAGGRSVRESFDAGRRAMAAVDKAQADVPVLIPGREDPANIRFGATLEKPLTVRAVKPAAEKPKCLQIFCSYSHKDEKYRKELETSLAALRMQGLVHVWHDRLIEPGTDWSKDINTNLEQAQVIVLLVSADFVASQYCMGVEWKRAEKLERDKGARVVPILVRECDLEGTPLARLQWLPSGAKPVKKWSDRDSAWTDVAKGIRKTVESLLAAPVQ